MLVVLALGRRLLSPLGAFLGAAAFALQPAHAEVVAYVSGRSTGLMALLLLAALWLWRPGSRWRLAGAGVLFAAAVAVKEVALVFPAAAAPLGAGLGGSGVPAAPARWHSRGWPGVLALAAGGDSPLPGARGLVAGRNVAQLQSLAWSTWRCLPEQLSLWFRPWALSVEHPVAAGQPLLPGLLFLAGAPRRGLGLPAPGA